MIALQPFRRDAVPRGSNDPLACDPATGLIDYIDCGVLICDRAAILLYANLAARRELSRAEPLAIRHNAIHCEASQRELEAAVRDATENRRSRLLSLGGGIRRLSVVAMPFALQEIAQPAALLMIGPRTPCSPLALAMLATRHKLTFTEHRVLQALLAGQTARETAEELGVRICTVRTHIQKVREKFGVRSIDELLILVARVPPVSTM